MQKRVEYIDIMRGIAMLLVVLGHCSSMDTINKTLLTFHMPLFFFISGLCFQIGGGYKSFIIKKLRLLGIPQLTFGCLTLIVGIACDVFIFHRETLQSFDYLSCFSQWFLITLFLMYAILWPIIRIARTQFLIFIAALIVGILFFLVSWNEVYYLQQTLCALFFSLLGYLARPYVDKYNETPFIAKGFGVALIMIVSIIASNQEYPVLMYINKYGNKLIFLVVALMGTLAITDISCCLKCQRFVQWIGRNSITIFITHFSLLYIYRGILSRIPDPMQIYSNSFILFLLVICTEIPITLFVNRYCPQIVGKYKQK